MKPNPAFDSSQRNADVSPSGRSHVGHASVQQTQRYLNVTDEELRKGLEISWKRRMLKAVSGARNA
jgi:hypothetical protein